MKSVQHAILVQCVCGMVQHYFGPSQRNILHVFVHSFCTIFLRGNSIFILPGHHYIGDDIANSRCARMGGGTDQCQNCCCETAISERKRTSVAGTGDDG